jgi:hypothetical protein
MMLAQATGHEGNSPRLCSAYCQRKTHQAVSHGASVLLVLGILGCHGGRTGAVEGDVFFRGPDGSGKPASGVVVRLVSEPDSLDARLGDLCRKYQQVTTGLLMRKGEALTNAGTSRETLRDLRRFVHFAPVALAITDSMRALALETTKSVHSVIAAMTIDSARAGLSAHFKFPAVSVGRYALVAVSDHDPASHAWFATVSVSSDSVSVRDLGISENRADELFCGIGPADVLDASQLYLQVIAQTADEIRARESAPPPGLDVEKAIADRAKQIADSIARTGKRP